MDERRKYPRLALDAEVDYKAIKGELFAITKNQSKNVGAGGVRIVTVDKLDVGTSLSLKFFLPGLKKPISAIGKVVWLMNSNSSNGEDYYDVGIEFLDIDDNDRDRINQFVRLKS